MKRALFVPKKERDSARVRVRMFAANEPLLGLATILPLRSSIERSLFFAAEWQNDWFWLSLSLPFLELLYGFGFDPP